MNTPFVSKLVPESCLPSLEEWQPAFFDCRGKLCPDFPSPAHAERYLDFLAHRIARRPNDLLAHVRRILMARAYRQGKILVEALQALFRVLGGRGAGLRAHLLRLCEPLLDAATVQTLRNPASSARSAAIVIVTRSVSQRTSARPAASGESALLTEALSYLDDGQIDEARSLLERHLKAFPADVGATQALIEIYQRARDHRALVALRQQLEPLPESVRPLWQAAAARLAKPV